MTKIWTEQNITLDSLLTHLLDSGLSTARSIGQRLGLHTTRGIAYVVAIDTDRKFVRIYSWLPLDKAQPADVKREFAHRLNTDVFLPTFYVDDESELSVSYVMPYEYGLIAGQFIAVVNRFASLLNYLVETADRDGLIKFDFDDEKDHSKSSQNQPGGLLN